MIGVLSLALGISGIALGKSTFGWSSIAFIWAPAIAVIPFSLLLEFGHRLEIRYFFKKRRVKIARIRGFRNHYRVDYLRDGKKMSGKWPKDFESWATTKSP
jgi:hypothetical protein